MDRSTRLNSRRPAHPPKRLEHVERDLPFFGGGPSKYEFLICLCLVCWRVAFGSNGRRVHCGGHFFLLLKGASDTHCSSRWGRIPVRNGAGGRAGDRPNGWPSISRPTIKQTAANDWH